MPTPPRALRISLTAPAALALVFAPDGLHAARPAAAPVAAVEDATDRLYARAVAAAQAGRADEAAVLFDEVLASMPAGHPLRGLALYGAGRANERRGTPEAACAAAAHYKTFIGLPDAEPEKREKVANALGALSVRCASATPALASVSSPSSAVSEAVTQTAAPAETRADHTWAWMATGGAALGLAGGALLLVAANGAVEDGDAAYARFIRSGRSSVSDRDDVLAANDRVETFGTAGYAVLGVGAVLGGLATWLWLRSPDGGSGSPSVVFGPTGAPGAAAATWGGRF